MKESLNRFYEKLSKNNWTNQLHQSKDGKVKNLTWGLFRNKNTGKPTIICIDQYCGHYQYLLTTLVESVEKNNGVMLEESTGLQIDFEELKPMVEYFEEILRCK